MEEKNYRENPSVYEEEELEIDLMEYARKLWAARKVLFKAAGIGALIGLVIAFSLPRQYTVEVTLVPEAGKGGSGGGLSSVTSMLGLGNMNMGNDADALNVTLFPDIVASTPFILDLFNAQVQTKNGSIDTTLVAYLDQQQSPWWSQLLNIPGQAIEGIVSLFQDEKGSTDSQTINPFRLTKKENDKVKALRESITANVDKKTGITTVSVTLQDPLATALVTDTVVGKLQEYITAYRVSKAQQNCDYLEELYKERQQEYYAAQQLYAQYMDANKGVVLQRALTERERLQNDMNLAFQVYSQVAAQLQVARAKVQEAKPVFAVVEPATVPLLPSGTGKKVIILGFIFLAVLGTAAWILLGKEFWQSVRQGMGSSKA